MIFCDAAAYDQGIMAPDEIAGTVKVRGRGGTKLQPGIDLLDGDAAFPKGAPLLIVTDGACDRLNLRGRTHAFLIPCWKQAALYAAAWAGVPDEINDLLWLRVIPWPLLLGG